MDRPYEEWTLLERLESIDTPSPQINALAKEASDEIVRLTARVAVLEIGVNEALTALSSKIAKPGSVL